MNTPRVDIGLLGPLQLEGAAGPTVVPRDRAVLTALAVHPGEVVSNDRLADALWGEDPPASWPKVVQSCVVRLRKALGPAPIETAAGGYRLATGDDLDSIVRTTRRAGPGAGNDGEADRAA